MKIKIIDCSLDTYWYVEMIGTEHEVIRAVTYPDGEGKGFQVEYDDGKCYVSKEDAEIVFEAF
jgi:hypothetical protein